MISPPYEGGADAGGAGEAKRPNPLPLRLRQKTATPPPLRKGRKQIILINIIQKYLILTKPIKLVFKIFYILFNINWL